MKPQLVMLAGPNGSGKTTYYENFLRATGLPFVNADRIAASTGLEGYEAAQVAGEVRLEYLRLGQSFVFETVFSDPVGDKLDFLRQAAGANYDVRLIYIGLASPALACARVASRVQEGGHDVPDGKIVARYARSLKNLTAAVAFVPSLKIYDNSSLESPYRLVVEMKNGLVVRRPPAPWPRWIPASLRNA